MKNSAHLARARRPRALSWAAVVAAALTTVVLAACGERLPVAPSAKQAATLPLPPAPSYIVQFGSGGAVPQSVEQAIRADGGHVIHVQKDMGLALVTGLTPATAAALRSSGAVTMVLPNVRRQYLREHFRVSHVIRSGAASRSAASAQRLTALAGDPRTAQFFSQQWNMTQIRADTAWRVTSQGEGTKVFILDTGVDTLHIDLAGRVDGSLSTSFAFADSDTAQANPLPFAHDVAGHGTFVSSLIASNSLGIAAVAPQTRLVMVRVLDDNGAGDDFGLISGILYAADNGADVVNVSLGGYLSRSNSFDLAVADLIQRAVDYAAERGALIVGAAGNEQVNSNTATGPHGSYADSMHVPAGGIQQVVSVGATGPVDQKNFDQIAEYSNFGKTDVAVFAPGGNDVDTTNFSDLVIGACSDALFPECASEDAYLEGAGTSFSAPLVAAEAAVIKAQAATKPTPNALESCTLTSADIVKGTTRPDPNYNFGRIDVLNGATKSKCT